MYRSPQRQTPRRAPVRTAPRRNLPGRPPRPGRPSRRSGPNLGPLIGLALIIVLLGAGSFFFWQSRRAPAAAEAAAITPAAPAGTATPALTPTATPPVISSGSVPGAESTTTIAPSPDAPAAANATPVATPAQVPQATSAPSAGNAALPAARSEGPDFAALARLMLERVNADRTTNGLQPVAWDAIASLAGQAHSEEMAEFGYMSHWNMDGFGPEYRYSRAGGLDFSQENVYRLVHTWQDGRGAPIDDWEQVVADAQAALMNSPGHRKNILAPEHTHLGVGIAYNPATGNVAIAQEFVNRYVSIEPLPKRGRGGDRIVLRGALLPGSTNPLVNIAYEPFPAPMTLEELNKTGTYTPAAETQSVPQVKVNDDGRFVSEFSLEQEAPPGLYHVLVWVEAQGAAERVLAVDAIIEVNG